MGDARILLFTGAVMLVASMIASGCIQDIGSSMQSMGGQVSPPAGSPSSGQRSQLNLTAAAGKLGVSEQDLENALNTTFQGRVNLTGTAQQLGVTTQQLADALNTTFQGRVNLTATAQQLGVTTQQLADALGIQFNASMQTTGLSTAAGIG